MKWGIREDRLRVSDGFYKGLKNALLIEVGFAWFIALCFLVYETFIRK